MAQEPKRRGDAMKCGTKLKIATFNAKGVRRIDRREEIKRWMRRNDVVLLAPQETNISGNAGEARE